MVQTAHPPIEAVTFVALLLTICLAFLPSIISSLDRIASVEILTTPRYSDVISKKSLAYIRLSIASFMFCVTLTRVLKKGSNGVATPYLETSKLRRKPIILEGIRSQVMYTAWSWNLLGLAFALNGIVTLLAAYNDDYGKEVFVSAFYKNLMRFGVIALTISSAASMMVSTITRYVLWSRAKKSNSTTAHFKTKTALLQHNANIILSLTEVFILGHVPMRIEYITLPILYGTVYVLHTWNMTHRLMPNKEPQFLYFFFDTTLDKKIVVFVLFSLICICVFFHCLYTGIAILIEYLEGGILCNILLVICISSCFCRFRD
jgi:hypothetical protein